MIFGTKNMKTKKVGGRGRPRRTKGKTRRIGFEATPDEIRQIDELAEAYGLSRAEFLRRRGLLMALPRRRKKTKEA